MLDQALFSDACRCVISNAIEAFASGGELSVVTGIDPRYNMVSVAQDTIIKYTGEKIIAKVTAITPMEIAYLKFEFLDGPKYTLLKNDVQSIKYANGTIDLFEKTSASPVKQENGNSTAGSSGTDKNNDKIFYGVNVSPVYVIKYHNHRVS